MTCFEEETNQSAETSNQLKWIGFWDMETSLRLHGCSKDNSCHCEVIMCKMLACMRWWFPMSYCSKHQLAKVQLAASERRLCLIKLHASLMLIKHCRESLSSGMCLQHFCMQHNLFTIGETSVLQKDPASKVQGGHSNLRWRSGVQYCPQLYIMSLIWVGSPRQSKSWRIYHDMNWILDGDVRQGTISFFLSNLCFH